MKPALGLMVKVTPGLQYFMMPKVSSTHEFQIVVGAYTFSIIKFQDMKIKKIELLLLLLWFPNSFKMKPNLKVNQTIWI